VTSEPQCLILAPESSAGNRLRRALEEHGDGECLYFVQSIEAMALLLSHPDHGFKLAVLLADEPGRLKDFAQLADQLADLWVLLVVPDSGDDTIALAHALGPRYLTRADSDFSELPEILYRLRRRWTAHSAEEPWVEEEGSA
jgi:hypothetical protein